MARDYAKISPRFWTGETGKKLRKNHAARVLAMYLISAPGSTMTGIYYLPLPTVSHETGMTMAEVIEALTFLASIDFARYDGEDEIVWIPEMAAWQIDEQLHANDKRVKGIQKELGTFRGHEFAAEFWERYGAAFHLGPAPEASPLEGPTKAHRSQEQDQEQEQEHSPSLPVLDSQKPPERAIPVLPSTAVVPARLVDPDLWDAHQWLLKFTAAWCEKYNRPFYGNSGDAKASATLSTLLERQPRAERLAAQAEAVARIAEFLASEDRGNVSQKHPFAFFVGAFGGLGARAGPSASRYADLSQSSTPRKAQVT